MAKRLENETDDARASAEKADDNNVQHSHTLNTSERDRVDADY